MVVIGIAMTFYGARFILYVLGFLIFAVIQGLFGSVSYSLGLFDPVKLYESTVEGKAGS